VRLICSAVWRDPASYSWIDSRRFELAEAECGVAVVDLVRAAPEYADTYLVQDQLDETGLFHGPFLLSSMTADAFKPLHQAQIGRALGRGLALSGPELRDRLRQHLQALPSSTWDLHALDRAQLRETDYASVFDAFGEVVLIDRVLGWLEVLVAGSD
jgi:hypothetical protein